MITRQEYDDIMANKFFRASGCIVVGIDKFKENEDEIWEELKFNICDEARHKDCEIVGKNVSDFDKMCGVKTGKYFLELIVEYRYKNYEAYLQDEKEKLQGGEGK